MVVRYAEVRLGWTAVGSTDAELDGPAVCGPDRTFLLIDLVICALTLGAVLGAGV